MRGTSTRKSRQLPGRPQRAGVTLRGQLVVNELKASEDISMPGQAVGYWPWVRRHQQAGPPGH